MNVTALEELLGLSLAGNLADIERYMANEVGHENSLCDASSRVLTSGGKRIRPILVAAVAAGKGDESLSERVLQCSASVEFLHIGSLVHDDLIDNATSRRGIPTVNSVEGWRSAILVGDYILGRSAQLAAAAGQSVAKAVSSALVDLVTGQNLEEETLFDISRTTDSALASIAGKTSSLMATSCRIGAICAGFDPVEIQDIANFGHAFGTAFQLIDDVLDWVSSESLMGKPVQQDVVAGVYTLPLLVARDRGADITFLRKRHDDQLRASLAMSAVVKYGGISATVELAHRYASEASEALEPLTQRSTSLHGLSRLPALYNSWALEHLVPSERRQLVQ